MPPVAGCLKQAALTQYIIKYKLGGYSFVIWEISIVIPITRVSSGSFPPL